METLDQKDRLLDEMLRRILGAVRAERVYLFGSRARGEGGPDSDYDLMVLVNAPQEPTYVLAQRAHEALWGIEAPADVLVWPVEKFDDWARFAATLPATILREGRLVYAG